MKNIGYFIKILVVTTALASCGKKKKMPVVIEQSLLDTIFCSTFEGIIPCPDCPGIETAIRIYKDSTISRTVYYQDKNSLPETKVGTWKLKDSIFEASFDREKLFYRLKNYNQILRVGSDLKEVKGEFANDYILNKQKAFKPNSIEGLYTVGDTLNLYNKLAIKHLKKEKYQLTFEHFSVFDSLQNCTTTLNANIDKSNQLNALLNKDKGTLRVLFTKKEAHVYFENIAVDSVQFQCNDSLRYIPFNGSYLKQNSTY